MNNDDFQESWDIANRDMAREDRWGPLPKSALETPLADMIHESDRHPWPREECLLGRCYDYYRLNRLNAREWVRAMRGANDDN